MDYKEKKYVSVICYLYDDAKNIEAFLQEITPVVSKKFECYQLVFVDDFSSDDSFNITTKLLEEMRLPGSIIRLSRKHGVENGLLAGLDKAVGDFVFELGSPCIDFPLDLFDQAFDAIKSGSDIVIIRPEGSESFFTRSYYYLFNRFSYFKEPIFTERMVVMTRRALNSVLSIDERIRYKKALLSLSGFPKKQLSYRPTNKEYSDKRTFYEKLLTSFENFASYTSLGAMTPMFLSGLFFIFSVLIGIWVVFNYFYIDRVAGVGWASIMGFMSLSFSGLFFLLGVLSQYITKISREIVNIPIYTIGRTFTSSAANEGHLTRADEVLGD